MAILVRNLAAFEDFRRRMADAAAGKFLPEVAKRVAAALVKQVADQFRQSRDPYGNPWAPVFRRRARDVRARARRARRGLPVLGDKPLIDTGRLRASVVARITGGSQVRIALPVEYASYHQSGTRTIARRQILPETDTGGLGPFWTLAINKEIAAVINKHLGGKP